MSAEQTFDATLDELIADQLASSPILASTLGAAGYDELLPDMAADAIAERGRREDQWTQRLQDVAEGELSRDQGIDRDFALMVLRGRSILHDWADWRRSADHYAGPALTGVFLLLLNRLGSEAEIARFVAARLDAVPHLLAQGRANLDAELAAPVDADRGEVAAAGERAAAAFEEFGRFVEDLSQRANGTWAIGERRYDALLIESEGLTYGARTLRDKGQAAYDELAEDMRRRAADLRGTDDFLAVLRGFNEDHPHTPEDMLALYTEATEAAREFCRQHDLVTMPPGERCVVAPSAPFSRSMLAVAHYFQPPPFAPGPSGGGARPGHFFVPYPPAGATPEQVAARLATNNRHGAWSVAVHEAYPGHHWQLCQRDYRLFRAARMVVDTSLHLGEMTIEQAVEHMTEATSLSQDTARAEVLRYCALPTQASSYLTGALEIARMRTRWEDEQRGSLREFHDRAAGSGRLPLGLVERALFDDEASVRA